jgi:hypothetical protein
LTQVDYTASKNWELWTVELFGSLYNEYKEGRYEGSCGREAREAMFKGNRGRSSCSWIGRWPLTSPEKEDVGVSKCSVSLGLGIVSVSKRGGDQDPFDDSDMTVSLTSGEGTYSKRENKVSYGGTYFLVVFTISLTLLLVNARG